MGDALAGLLVLTSFTLASAAHAADATTVAAAVRLEEPSCPNVPLAFPDFVEALRVELAGRALPSGAILVRLAVEPCAPSTQRVEVVVADEGSGQTSAREVGLEDVVYDARPRALALAVAELIRRAQRSSPLLASATVALPGATPATSQSRSRALAVGGEGVACLFPTRDLTLWGGRLVLSAEGTGWRVGAFGEIVRGEHGYSDGDVEVQSFGAGLVVGPRWSFERLSIAPAIVGELAFARIEGQARGAGVVAKAGDALTAAVRGRVEVGVRPKRRISVDGFVEGGFVARGFDAVVDGGAAAGISGVSVVLGIGVRIVP